MIFFHAGFSAFSGGFVGVDVFFVISGYLITTIILSDLDRREFSLISFYERRARRILPALFLVMLVSLLFAWIWLLPSDMKDFSQSLVAVSTFSSNVLFWYESDYWDAASELKPLLHTWSLAVEEQYYVVFPLFLLWMWSHGKRFLLGSLILITAASFFLAQWGSYQKPSATFYLLPTRAWELGIGACIALYFSVRKITSETYISHSLTKEILGIVGLLMIGYAVFIFDKTTPFPSIYALIPTAGTALVLLASSTQTIAGRLLSTKPLVAVGLISYSAYLWHQPLFVFARHRTLHEPTSFIYIVLACASLIFAYLSWRYVEKPFRSKGLLSRRTIFSFSIFGSSVFIVIGLAGFLTNGFDSRSSSSQIPANLIDRKVEVNHGLSMSCEGSFTLSGDCRTHEKPEILVWGDSYAMHLVQGIMASKHDAKIIQMTKSMCGPLFDIAPIVKPNYSIDWGKQCLEFSGKVRNWLKQQTSIKYAVLSSPFTQYLESKNNVLTRNGNLYSTNLGLVIDRFLSTLNELESMGITPIVFSPPPTNGTNLGRCLAKAEWFGSALDYCNFRVSDMAEERLQTKVFLKQINEKYKVIFLDELLCSDMSCKTHIGKNYIFRDTGHFSQDGSAELGKKFDFYEAIVNQ